MEAVANLRRGVRQDPRFGQHELGAPASAPSARSRAGIGAYTLANFDKNRFAGIEGRWEEGGGAVIKVLIEPTDKLEFEIGISAIQQHAVGALPDRYFAAGRLTGAYKHHFSEHSYFQETAEYLPNLQASPDWRFNSESSLIAPISTNFGVKGSYVIHFQHLPQPGFGDTDRLFSTGIQVTF